MVVGASPDRAGARETTLVLLILHEVAANVLGIVVVMDTGAAVGASVGSSTAVVVGSCVGAVNGGDDALGNCVTPLLTPLIIGGGPVGVCAPAIADDGTSVLALLIVGAHVVGVTA
eukprot:gene2966-2155_t